MSYNLILMYFSSACQQVVKVIKKNLAQCSICKFTKEDLDVVTENILSRIAAIIEDNERKAAASPDKVHNSKNLHLVITNFDTVKQSTNGFSEAILK